MRYHEYMLKGGPQKYKDDEGNIYYVDRLGGVTDDTGFTFQTNLHDPAASWVFGDLTPIENPDFYWDARVEKNNEKDQVNHPSHYNEAGVECIEAIRASLGPIGFQAYCKGNCMKYLWRYEYKNGLEDLKKAQVYLNWMVESKEGGS